MKGLSNLFEMWMLSGLRSRLVPVVLLTTLTLLGGCAGLARTPAPLLNYKPEAFGASTYSRRFAAEPAQTCEAARRALLGQGYIVVDATDVGVTARKYFQPSVEHHVQFEFRVVCAPENAEFGAATIAFANGLQDQYNIRKVKESASLGVGGFGSLSLPVEGSMDSMVKVGSETVSDDELYQRFFDLVAQYIDSVAPPEQPAAHPDAERQTDSTPDSSSFLQPPVVREVIPADAAAENAAEVSSRISRQ